MYSPYFSNRVCALVVPGLLLFSLTLTATAQESDVPDHPLFTSQVHEIERIDFDQEHVRLAIRFEPEAGQIYGTAKLRLRPKTNAPDSVVLDASNLNIYSIQVGLLDSLKRAATYSDTLAGQLVVHLDSLSHYQKPFEIQVTYLAKPEAGLIFNSKSSATQGVHVWTDVASGSSNSWLPLINNPADLLTSEIIATVPPDVSVLANGRLTERLVTEDGMNLYHYVQDQPHSTEHIGLFTGRMKVDSSRVSLENGYSFPVTYWLADEQEEDVQASLSELPDMFSFFSDFLDFTYPWPSFSALILESPYVRDMSLTGITVLNDDIVKDERALADSPESLRLASLVARQWYTHLIPVDFKADLWLTESLSAYLGLLYVREKHGEAAFQAGLYNMANAYFAESALYRRPLVWNRWEHPSQLKDAHSTAKGAWALHSLHTMLGDEEFRGFMQRLTRNQAFTPTNTDRFFTQLTESTNLQPGTFFDDWIYSAGHPELDINYQYDLVSESLYVAIDQVQTGYLVPPVYNMNLELETYTLAGPESMQISLDADDQLFSIPMSIQPRYVIVGPRHPYLIASHTTQDASSWITQLRYASHPMSQLQAIKALEEYTDDPALLIGLQSSLRSRPGAVVQTGIITLIAKLPPSEASQRVLLDAFEGEAPEVQIAVLQALSEFEDTSELTIIAMDAAQSSESYLVQAEAVRTLAKIQGQNAYGIIQSALITPSHRDVIRRAALESLFDLSISTRDRISIAREYSTNKYSTEARLAAIGVLKVLAGHDNRQSRNLLQDLLSDREYVIREAVLDAFREVGNEEDLEMLTNFEENEDDIRLQLKSRDVMSTIRAHSAEPTSP